MTKLLDLKAQRANLLATKQAIIDAQIKPVEDQIKAVEDQMSELNLAAYPLKVGDVFEAYGRTLKVVRLYGYHNDVCVKVVQRNKSGWSKRERHHLDWNKMCDADDEEKTDD